jgi:endonuclease/exonuclease/phosphatase family metal-dependent hydrolase
MRVTLTLVTAALTTAAVDGSRCAARVDRVGDHAIAWIGGPSDDRIELERWCRGVGGPVLASTPSPDHAPPPLERLVVLTWNAHLAEGRVTDLIAALADGSLTGQPEAHYVVLVQELFRRGDDMPPFPLDARSARAIRARDQAAADVTTYARTLGLSLLYVPAMRNGPDLREDRGNAILSTEPLENVASIELPLERQRRVAISADVMVMRAGRQETLRLVNTHLEPLSSPASLWFFRNPRSHQMASLLENVALTDFDRDGEAGTVLAGDFNTVKAGADERAYRLARKWGRSTLAEDHRPTHFLGRLDYILFRLRDGWAGTTERSPLKFGSDHHPVIGRFARVTP